MAFLRLPTKTESKRSIAPAPQAPKPLPKAAPRPAAVPVKPAVRGAPGPTTVAEGPKRRMLGLGGQAGDVSLPPSSDTVKPYLDALTKEWDKTDRSAQLVLAQSKNLIGLGTSVRQINSNN